MANLEYALICKNNYREIISQARERRDSYESSLFVSCARVRGDIKTIIVQPTEIGEENAEGIFLVYYICRDAPHIIRHFIEDIHEISLLPSDDRSIAYCKNDREHAEQALTACLQEMQKIKSSGRGIIPKEKIDFFVRFVLNDLFHEKKKMDMIDEYSKAIANIMRKRLEKKF